ncbi:MAG: glutamate racemase [Gammaproteobacteria bacterium]|nr:glutamate racemase [Gammaproteobacteria bacterium]
MQHPGGAGHLVGVFDSGVGGLSVLKAIRRQRPDMDFTYIADSLYAPYGQRPPAFIEARAASIADALLQAGARIIVVACNTATAVAVEKLRARLPVPLIAMEPAIKPAVAHTRSGVVGVLATTRTLESANVARLCREFGHGVQVLLQPCPGLVERVEQGDLYSAATRDLLLQFTTPLLAKGVDTLVLGCTHYVFLTPLIRELVGEAVSIIESSEAVARHTLRHVEPVASAADVPRTRREIFLTTGVPGEVQAVFSQLWGAPVEVSALGGDHVGA